MVIFQDSIRERGTLNVNNYSRGLFEGSFGQVISVLRPVAGIDGNRTGFYFHPALDNPADCLPPDVPSEPTFYTPNLWPDTDRNCASHTATSLCCPRKAGTRRNCRSCGTRRALRPRGWFPWAGA